MLQVQSLDQLYRMHGPRHHQSNLRRYTDYIHDERERINSGDRRLLISGGSDKRLVCYYLNHVELGLSSCIYRSDRELLCLDLQNLQVL